MLSTSKVLLKLVPDPEVAEEPRARGEGEVDKEDEPGPAERFVVGDVENAEGGGGEADRKGFPPRSGEVAVIVCVVGI